ncbi:hypothetical protein [Nocardia seriolae]|uniref:Uncharacterized protein n=1 Tax=Nocardia seriolae TaxID=37332 RepID=A0A0B8N9F4_9NOCA|nr:hypothetical protein [Nocardia seriolae]APB01517.1 hypothetical protein NS506_07497 [Nocardia seriolae]MTJ60998.1 hypothetical protein [Nocardia seriolae]MTJ70540.1 hypothetical protein [Nocardia seriolae]MTJ90869.1 hypothetical protein [Nocardia seriolae]MTK34826.1 hypothetical protein [Nocardia seriolae]
MHAFLYAVPVILYLVLGAVVVYVTLRRTTDADPRTRRAEIWRAYGVLLVPVLVGPILIGGITGHHFLQFLISEFVLAALVLAAAALTVRRAVRPATER